ncbi:MAG TPA: methyltransferase [Blastocatellia bacterium]|nr:methyltransferase [Blastocatellia bacterium]
MTTQDKVIDLIFGRWRSQILYAGVRLGIFEALREQTKDASTIAQELKLDAELGYRLLRALASLELLHEESGRRFALTEAGRYLLADHPQTLRGMTLLEEGPEHYALWKHLPAMIRDGQQNAFVREFGRMAFAHAEADAGYAEVFDEAMTSYSSTQTALALEALEGYDFSGISHLCDVGGGHGHLLAGFLAKYPHLRGSILDRPEVLADAARLWPNKLVLGDRFLPVPGDMFEAVPTADAYVMKLILHDWNDDECVQILRTVHRAANDGARLFIVEHLITAPDEPHFAKLFDIHMMCWGTGRERTPAEYAVLLERAGWAYQTTLYPASRLMGIVAGERRDYEK